MGELARVSLQPDRTRSLSHRHPWVFSGAVGEVHGNPEPGDLVRLESAEGGPLALAFYNPQSQIALRVVSWDPEESVNAAFWSQRIESAVRRRQRLSEDSGTDAYRLIHSEADGLPGLIVDRYGDYLVVQLSSLGIERARDEILAALVETCSPRGIWHRPDKEVREKEGLSLESELLHGEPPPEEFVITEGGRSYAVDLVGGSKTGFFLDQRPNRARIAEFVNGGEALDAFCYSGSFSVALAAAGCHRVVQVDSSAPALELAARNYELNAMSAEREQIRGNVFEVLRRFRDGRRQFRTIVLDPPKLAASRSQVGSARRAYKDANLLALKLLEPGGILFTFSCSGALSEAQFRETLYHATTDVGRDVHVLAKLGPGTDHPVSLTFPESEYLKGFVLRAL